MKLFGIVLTLAAFFSLTSCWESKTENAAEDVIEKTQEIANDVGDQVEDAADDMKESAKDAIEDTND